MKLASIKPGLWYETSHGVGQCVQAGGTYPPSVQIRIVAPFPRGLLNFRPKDVVREVPAPKQDGAR